jgi:hypothetical protein
MYKIEAEIGCKWKVGWWWMKLGGGSRKGGCEVRDKGEKWI